MDYEEAIAIWDEMAKTRYSDDVIRNHINIAIELQSSEKLLSNEYAEVEASIAQTMIAYNEMINDRIINAKNSWGLK